jgi:hypothetical protein
MTIRRRSISRLEGGLRYCCSKQMIPAIARRYNLPGHKEQPMREIGVTSTSSGGFRSSIAPSPPVVSESPHRRWPL